MCLWLKWREFGREIVCNLTTSIHNQFEKEKPSLPERERGECGEDITMFLKYIINAWRERERFSVVSDHGLLLKLVYSQVLIHLIIFDLVHSFL